MTPDLDTRLAELDRRLQDRDQCDRRLRAAREKLIQARDRLWAIEAYLEQERGTVRSLESFSFGGLLASLTGGKEAQLGKARQACAELEQRETECRGMLCALEREVADLEAKLATLGDPRAEYDALLAEKQAGIHASGDADAEQLLGITEELAGAQALLKAVERASEAVDEARTVLRDELANVSALGRCKIAEGSRGIRGLMGAARQATAGQCGSRVVQALGLLQRRVEDVVERSGAADGELLVELQGELTRLGAEFSGGSLVASRGGAGPADAVWSLLQNADMVLEQKLTAARGCIAALEARRRGMITSA